MCNVEQILTMIARIKLLWKSYLVCSDINERFDIRQASFTSVFEVFFLHYKYSGGLSFHLSHILDL